MTFITLIRHGQTDWNLVGRIQGATDIPLNDTGRGQARAAATALPSLAAVLLAASDLARARETASIIGAHRGWGEPMIVPELRERGYGEAEGTLVADFGETFGPWHQADIPGAESTSEVVERTLRGLRLLSTHAASDIGESVHVVAVTHGAVLSALLNHLGELSDGDRVGNGAAHTFDISDNDVRLVTAAEGAVLTTGA